MKPIVKPGRVMNPGFPTRVFDDLFFNGINRFWGSDQCDEIPAVNISKTEDGYTIEVSAPGLEKSDFAIVCEDGRLNISAEKSTENTNEGEQFIKREFNYTKFNRSFTLDDTLDTESINAAYNHGILTIKVSKKAEAPKLLKQIEIK
jgi:HSP20 family protein